MKTPRQPWEKITLIVSIIGAIITLLCLSKQQIPRTYIVIASSIIYLAVLAIIVRSWTREPKQDDDELTIDDLIN